MSTTFLRTGRLSRQLLAAFSITLFTLTACGDSDNPPLITRGPASVDMAGSPNGAYWDGNEARLYLTEEDSNSLRAWDGADGFPVVATLPAPPASGNTLGQLTRTGDGTLYVTRFGFGTDGTVIAAPRHGDPHNLNGLAPERRRIGLTTTPDGALLVGWFIRGGSGAISELTVNGNQASERELITGLGKPVGIAITGDRLVITDQNEGQVLAFSLSAVRQQPQTAADGQLLATFTTLDGIDLMTAAPDGTLFFGGRGGNLFALSPDGAVRSLATGWPTIRGVAYDPAQTRLFAVVDGSNEQASATLRVIPID